MASVCEALDALLSSAQEGALSNRSSYDNDEPFSLEERQAELCQRLLESLERQETERVKKRDSSRLSLDSFASNFCEEEDEEDDDESQPPTKPTNFIHTPMPYNNKSKTRKSRQSSIRHSLSSGQEHMTVREIFADSTTSTGDIPQLLASLITNRVDTEKVLPATQDAQANEDAMNSVAALTITKPALIATELYAKLLALPGAYGSGLIEMEAVSTMAAMFRRWRIECMAAIDMLLSERKGNNKKKKNAKKKRTGGKRKTSKKAKDLNPTKRRRNPKRSVNFDLSSEEEEESGGEYENGHDGEVEEEVDPKATTADQSTYGDDEQDDGVISPKDLILLGLKAALAMSEVPLQREFMSWSSESREAIIDAVTFMYGNVCALVTPSVESKLDPAIVELRAKVVDRATICLKQCILRGGTMADKRDDYDDDDEAHGKRSVSAKRHETSVYIFRGLFPFISMKVDVPNGEAGKQIVCEMVADTIQGFVKEVTEDMSSSTSAWTPASTAGRRLDNCRRASLPASDLDTSSVAPKTTSKKGRKKRVSFGGIDTQKTPTLKSGKKPPRPGSANGTPGQGLGYLGTKPRPVLSAVLGLLQKLATADGLEKATLRGSIVQSVHTCLRYLPSLERSNFLRFLNRLCKSKVAVHRLVGAELVGLILAEPWLWKDHINQHNGTPIVVSMPQSVTKTPNSQSFCQSGLATTPGSQSSSVIGTLDEGLDIPSSLLESLEGRLTDKSPGVRSRAAGALADLLKKVSSSLPNEDKENERGVERDLSRELRKCLSIDGCSLIFALRKRALSDDSATVRRTVIGALVELLLLAQFSGDFNFDICEEDIDALGQLCRDRSMLTRKAAAQGLTKMLHRCSSANGEDGNTTFLLERAWATSVLPLTLDTETICVSKAVELVYQIVIQPISTDDDSASFDRRSYNAAWRILTSICEGSGSGEARGQGEALKAALTKLTASDSVPNDFSRALLRRICDVAVSTLDGTQEELCELGLEAQRSGVWCLFDALVDQTKDLPGLYRTLKKLKIDLDFLGTSWEKMLKLLEMGTLPIKSGTLLRACMRSCLRLLSKLASCVHLDIAERSGSNLHTMLQRFMLPADLIGSAVSALAATSIVCSGGADIEVVRADCKERIEALYKTCEDTIATYVKQATETGLPTSETEEEAVVRAIFTTGELAVLGFSPDDDDAGKRGQQKKNGSATQSDPLRGLKIQPNKQLVDLVLTFLPRNFIALDSVPTPETARAHAYIAVGKLCLRDENLAKKCLTILARELHENLKDGCPRVQSNALLVLGDLCIRYTSMVDRYLPVMAACLQSGHALDESILSSDKSAIVRKHAILLLSSLLLQDYIKWRGLLFHRFLVACADNDESVASVGESILVGPLLSKCPKLFFNNFVESFFVLNRCTAHPIYLAAASSGDGGGGIAVGFEGINLSGRAGRVKRFRMYELMLSKMSDEEKIGITARLAKEVLGSALSSGSDLYRVCTNPQSNTNGDKSSDRAYDSAFNVLSDCFTILCSPALRVGKSCQTNDDDNDIVEDPNNPTNPTRRVIAAKGKLLSKISRKHLIEIVFPILCNLKAMLQKSCSPLLKELMAYMVHIFRAYKTEVKDFLSNDPGLLQEIEYDAKRALKKTPVKATANEEGDENGSPEASGRLTKGDEE